MKHGVYVFIRLEWHLVYKRIICISYYTIINWSQQLYTYLIKIVFNKIIFLINIGFTGLRLLLLFDSVTIEFLLNRFFFFYMKRYTLEIPTDILVYISCP